jgi:hypothetical protein
MIPRDASAPVQHSRIANSEGASPDVDQMLSKLVGRTGFWCGLASTTKRAQAIVLTWKSER